VVNDLEVQVKRNEKRAEALLADPLVNHRIIRRELNYRSENEEVFQWPVAEVYLLQNEPVTVSPKTNVSSGDSFPAWLLELRRWLPNWPWERLFVKPSNRLLLLMLSGGLIVTAFVLYGPKPSRQVTNRS